jgi:hypothetical protein
MLPKQSSQEQNTTSSKDAGFIFEKYTKEEGFASNKHTSLTCLELIS